MNKQELKAWLDTVPDNAVIKMREESWRNWRDEWQLQAVLHIESQYPPVTKEPVTKEEES